MSRIKVLEVGDGAQAAAIRDGLDRAKFDVTLVDAISLGQLRRLFAEKRPDVVHAHGPKAGALVRLAARFAGVGKIFESPRGGDSLAPGRAIETAADWFGAASAPLDFHIHLGSFPEPKAHEGLVVGSLGAMDPAHRPDEWVLLAQRLCDSRNGLTCLWIGGGPDEAAARVNLTNMNLLIKVSVTGELPDYAARERLRELDLFVHYTRSGADSGPLWDAMACGLPVVASDLPAHREAVVDGVTGYLVKNEVELLERCQALLDDDDLRRRLGDAGRERVRHEFSRERQLAELSRRYSA